MAEQLRDKVFREGRLAFCYGLAREDDCPYEPDTADAGWWLDGWDYEDQKHAEAQEDAHG